jgi:hypothetical protein
MSGERAGGGTAGDGVQRGGLRLHKAPLIQIVADGADNLDPLVGALERLRRVDQIEVAVPQAELDILHAVVAGRVWFERFGQHRQRTSLDGQLATPGGAEVPVDADEVPQIEQLGQLPAQLADLLLAQQHLDFARLVPQIEEVQLALVASAHDPPRRPDQRQVRLAERLGGQLADLADGHCPVETPAPGVDAQLLDAVQLFQAGQLGLICGRGGWMVLAGHCRALTCKEVFGLILHQQPTTGDLICSVGCIAYPSRDGGIGT